MLGCFKSNRHKLGILPALVGVGLLAAGMVLTAPPSAHAQEIIATVNGAPITNWDVSERQKLLRAIRRPSSSADALNSMIDDTLENSETDKFKISISDADIGQQIAVEANEFGTSAAALLGALQRDGVSQQHIKDHFAADFKFDLLVRAYNKGIDASETAIRAELAKDGGKSAAGVDYRLRQIIFTLRGGDVFAETQARIKSAEQLRLRFSSCAEGVPLARGMDDVAVKDEIVRNSLQIGDALKQLLDKTPTGHLTPPERTSEGVEMIAVCSKGASNDDTTIRKAISQRLLSAQMRADAKRRLEQLRSYAVIVKR